MKWQVLTPLKNPKYVNVPQPEDVRFEFDHIEGEFLIASLKQYSKSTELDLVSRIIVSTMALKMSQVYAGTNHSGSWNFGKEGEV